VLDRNYYPKSQGVGRMFRRFEYVDFERVSGWLPPIKNFAYAPGADDNS